MTTKSPIYLFYGKKKTIFLNSKSIKITTKSNKAEFLKN